MDGERRQNPRDIRDGRCQSRRRHQRPRFRSLDGDPRHDHFRRRHDAHREHRRRRAEPASAPVDSITIQFNEPVAGFNLADLQFTLNGVGLPLNGATLTTGDLQNWTLDNLSTITSSAGNYQLTLAATGWGISDFLGNPLTVGANLAWQTVVPLAGDFNLDGKVDGPDLNIWKANNGKTSGATFQMGDANHDGAVDNQDYLLWKATAGPGDTTGSGGNGSPISGPVTPVTPTSPRSTPSVHSDSEQSRTSPGENADRKRCRQRGDQQCYLSS